ncbi:MAG: hypothetical protein ACLQNE_27290 [Thermoguttaceae bacterium]
MAAMAAVMCASATISAAEQVKGFVRFNASYETFDLFPAIESGKIDVQMIPKDSTACTLLVTNKTEKPLNIRVPDVLAGVPVLAQFGNMPFPGGLNGPGKNAPAGKGKNGGEPQPVGMPVTPNGNRQGGNGAGMANRGNNFNGNQALFSVAPEKVGQLKLPCVCLEYGKPMPRPLMSYQVRAIERVTDKTAVHEMCRMLGRDELDQKTAQAAVWHLNNGMSWEELAAKKIRRMPAWRDEPLFTAKEIADAKKAVESLKEPKKAATGSVTMSGHRSEKTVL